MKARTATVGDLEDVFRDLSKRMSDEYVAAGKDPKIAYDNLMMNLKEGRAHALVQNDKTAAIVAWHEHSDAAVTLFAAREDFFSAATVRFCKRHIRQIQALAGNLPIHSTSWLRRPDVAKWFRIIGYVEREPVGGASLFELPPATSERRIGHHEAGDERSNVEDHRRTGDPGHFHPGAGRAES